LERLIKDGRIHPSSIEQAVEDANEQVQKRWLSLAKTRCAACASCACIPKS
jgi:hypothetical protein